VTSLGRRLAARPLGAAALTFLALLTVACVAAPLVAPYDPRAQDLANVLGGPSPDHVLGTDTLGRDVLSRLLYGGRRSLLSMVEALAVVLSVGVPLGLVAGYAGGWTDRVLSRFAEILLSVPAIVLVLVALAVFPHNADAAMVTFGLLGAPAVLRVVRSATLAVREELYVAAARVSGLSHPRIMVRHVLPMVTGPIVVQASVFCAYALLFETGIAYLGLTADPATPTWGGMVAEASTVLQQQAWLLAPSGTLIALTILACGLLGDAVGEAAGARRRGAPRGQRRRAARRPGHTPVRAAGVPGRAGDNGALLQVEKLSVAVEGGTPVVDGVSFDVLPGETVGLVGESGCGKTATALAVLRLLPDALRVTGGGVLWEGADVRSLPDRDFDELRGSAVAYVSQEAQSSLDPTFSVGSQLVEVIRRHERAQRADARRRAVELLRLVELPDPERVARSHAFELSGGMAQRVAIALALAGRPRLLIADEPTTALDVTVQSEILSLLRRLRAKTSMAILMITHNWGVVADFCDRTVVMYAGQVVEQAETQAMFDQPLHPYTAGLLASHPSLAEPGAELAPMPGRVPAPGAWPTGCRFAPRCPHVREKCLSGEIALRAPEPDRVSRCVRVEELTREVCA
jgi:peptide/nickel transport system permease protein